MTTRRGLLTGLAGARPAPLVPIRAQATTALPERDGRPCSFCQTGEPYDILCSEGVKREGVPAIRFPTPAAAWSAYHEAFRRYVAGKKGTLYWRHRPVLESAYNYTAYGFDQWGSPKVEQYVTAPGHFVYSRLVVSDKPEIYKLDMYGATK